MAIIYYAYLFDDAKFFGVASPLIPELEIGNYRPLYSLAKKTLDSQPELWDKLYDLNLGYSFEEEAEGDLDPNSLLMKVLVQFLKPIEVPNPDAWRMLNPTLPMIGWSEVDTKLLLYGKSLCTLLVPERMHPPEVYYDLSSYKTQDRPWCEGYIGWLDSATINQLRRQLVQSRERYFKLAEHPNETLQKEFHFVENFSLAWLSGRLIDSYTYTIQVLDIAHKAEMSLAMAIA